jgi:hypothetical protein
MHAQFSLFRLDSGDAHKRATEKFSELETLFAAAMCSADACSSRDCAPMCPYMRHQRALAAVHISSSALLFLRLQLAQLMYTRCTLPHCLLSSVLATALAHAHVASLLSGEHPYIVLRFLCPPETQCCSVSHKFYGLSAGNSLPQ